MYTVFLLCDAVASVLFLAMLWLFTKLGGKGAWVLGLGCCVVLGVNGLETHSFLKWQNTICKMGGVYVYRKEFVEGYYLASGGEGSARAAVKAGYKFVEIDDAEGKGFVRIVKRNGETLVERSEKMLSSYGLYESDDRRYYPAAVGKIDSVKDIGSGEVLARSASYYYFGGGLFRRFVEILGGQKLPIRICPSGNVGNIQIQAIPPIR